MFDSRTTRDVTTRTTAGDRPPRFRGYAKTWVLALLLSVWGSCYEDSSGCVIVGVGEPVGDSS